MTIKTYLESAALTGKTILTGITHEPRRVVRLRETWFHAQGGGQRGDRGWIGTARVLDTRHGADGEVDHFVDSVVGLVVGQVVDISVDGNHRRRGAFLHSGGHLIADAMQAIRPSARAVAGHHWENEARVEFEGEVEPSDALPEELSDCLSQLIAADLPIRIVGDPFRNRAISVGEFEPVGCGGTHVATTGELAGLRISSIRKKSGRLRVSYQGS
jgi:Ser-tRNA(Ala) deacylase AlaX